MSQLTRDTATEHLGCLEQKLRRWKILGAAAVGALGLGVLLGATGEKVAEELRAKRFVLVDTEGKERAELTVASDGGSALFFYDKNGKLRAGLGLGPEGLVELALGDKNSQPRAQLRVKADGETVLSFYDKDLKPRASLSMTPDGLPGLALFDKNGQTHAASLQLEADGSPALALSGKLGKPGAGVLLTAKESPALVLFDENLKVRSWLGLSSTGSPRLIFNDENQKARAVLGHTALEVERTGTVEQRPASSLLLFDKDGKVIWRTP